MNISLFYYKELQENYFCELHSHQFVELVLSRGTGGYICNEDNEKLYYEDGDILIYNAFVKHCVYNKKKGVHYCLGINKNSISGIPDIIMKSDKVSAELFYAISEEFKLRDKYFIQIAESRANELVYYLKRQLNNKPENLKQDDESAVLKIKNIIEDNFQKDLSIQYITDHVFLSSEYINHLFKNE